ncbi:MAG TPA: hypothetical protein PKY77_19340 [Phycisphaerae bacterium]|nr:hypothetical protein [Phycisphaerae bacterium]HRY68499.1 hypothetical protein [Phycisphaerae bacterium]HSA25547.1 hypothetical protein [Phycisphaerae bacterium]
MSSARVQSIDALKDFRVMLCKFSETAKSVLGDVESELGKVLNWLETEQPAYWQGQIRHRTESVAKAKQAVLIKKLTRNVDGGQGSAIEEEKALKVALARLEEANLKLGFVQRYCRELQKEILLYKGQVQRFSTMIGTEIPRALNRLDWLAATLDAYLAVAPAAGGTEIDLTGSVVVPPDEVSGGMARPEPAPGPEPIVPPGPAAEGAPEGGEPEPRSGGQVPET